jgi:hypothetical protein
MNLQSCLKRANYLSELELVLSRNQNLNDDGMVNVAIGMRDQPRLTSLKVDFSDCEKIGSKGMALFG